MKTVPVVPDRLRKEKYSSSVRGYINDEIDEAELESEIEDALLGRPPFEEVMQLSELMPPHQIGEPDGKYQLYGVEIEYGDTIEPEETPNLVENPLIID